MNEQELRQGMLDLDPPGEQNAGARSWGIVRVAFEQREPPSRRGMPVRALLVLAVIPALVAGALSPPGRALVDSIREAIGVEDPRPALFSLPAEGRLLVVSEAGTWVVDPSGTRRLLGPYSDAAWSPRGLFVAATRGDELTALEPGGGVRWALARPRARLATWGGTTSDTRIAYLSGQPARLRVVAGDGSPDTLVAADPLTVRPAWRPSPGHVLAYATRAGRVAIVDADAGRELGRSGRIPVPLALAWSPRGDRLLALSRRSLRLIDTRGRVVRATASPGGAQNLAAAFHPRRKLYAVSRYLKGSDRSEVVLSNGRRPFEGTGRIDSVAWSSDGRWLVLGWPDADQLVFVRVAGSRRIEAVANVTLQFESASFPRLAGWCC